jgi:beta-lactam-binding protein with PASTA domain
VELITSSGVCVVQVPNVVGFTSAQANTALMDANLIGAFSQAPVGSCPATEAPGTVITQSVAAGTTAPYGSTVDVTVCPNPTL